MAAGFDVLGTIVAATRARVAAARERVGLHAMTRLAADGRPDGARFERALYDGGEWRVIAECKRRSPSRGVLRGAYDAAEIAQSYESAGAAAISVLTEPSFFDGDLAHLRAVRDAVGVPLLRKDFIVEAYQVLEARAAGADALLLIVAALSDADLKSLLGAASDAGLATLVEVHDLAELHRAVDAGARVIGVNNRSLKTLSVSTEVATTLAAAIPNECIAVAESGLRSGEDLRSMRDAGYDAFLIGERLVSLPEPGQALADLLADADATGRRGHAR